MTVHGAAKGKRFGPAAELTVTTLFGASPSSRRCDCVCCVFLSRQTRFPFGLSIRCGSHHPPPQLMRYALAVISDLLR